MSCYTGESAAASAGRTTPGVIVRFLLCRFAERALSQAFVSLSAEQLVALTPLTLAAVAG